MSDAITLLVGPSALTDEQLSEVLSIVLADEDVKARVDGLLRGCGGHDVPAWVTQLLTEYKRRHVRPKVPRSKHQGGVTNGTQTKR